MKIIDVEQGSPEWQAARRGIPTASEFEKILTPTGKPSGQAAKYAYKLAVETLLGEVYDEQGRVVGDISNLPAIVRGKMLEPQAAADYEFELGVSTRKIGFITTDDGRAGASPDRLINTGSDLRGAVEFKCPYPHTHMAYLQEGFDSDYVVQAQGQILICELDFVDRVSYLPGAPTVRVRTWRDDAFCKALGDALVRFSDTLENVLRKAREAGPWTPVPYVAPEDFVRSNGFRGRERHDPNNAFNWEFTP